MIKNGIKWIGEKAGHIYYAELDNKHFIIPKTVNNGEGSAIFSIDENNNIVHKGDIEGYIFKDTTQNKSLMKEKQLHIRIEIDKRTGEYEEFFYSWDKNCRTSDIWSSIIQSNDINAAIVTLQHMHINENLIYKLAAYMEENNNANLATLNLKAEDDEEQVDFICFIGANGVPICDMTCIDRQNKSHKYQVSGKIGEVDRKKEEVQRKLDKRFMERIQNGEDLPDDFFKISGLPMKGQEKSIEENKAGEDYRSSSRFNKIKEKGQIKLVLLYLSTFFYNYQK